jgi:aryl-alcohol dehydrogenase-like predicted oxidoreductase
MIAVEYVRLGTTGLKVSRLALGCMSFGSRDREAYAWTLGEDDSRPFFRLALDAGINFFDTADAYSRGAGEIIVGKMLKEMARREEVIIATKVFHAMGSGPNDRGLSRKHVMASIDASLKRLQTDHVDLYQIHRFDEETPIEETLGALNDIVRAGKARYIGATTMYAWEFARMLAASERRGWERFVSMQLQYSPVYREDEREMFPLCMAEGIGLMNWSPLAGGFLAHGRATPEAGVTERGRTPTPLGTPYDREPDRRIFAAVSALARKRGVSNAEIVYAWSRSKRGLNTSLVGATRLIHLEQAIASLQMTLSPEEIAAIEQPYEPREVFGHKVKPH